MYISIESDLRRSPDPCIQDVDEDRMKLYGQSRGHVLPADLNQKFCCRFLFWSMASRMGCLLAW